VGMKVKIRACASDTEVKCHISETKDKTELPTITDGWRFNFRKNSNGKNLKTYVLSTDSAPKQVEGCMIINTENRYQDYMAFVEVAPHNKGENKRFDKVAGCLIAFACKQSFIKGKEGYLALDVLEENAEDQIKLMEHYSKKYHASRLAQSTTMIIVPEASEKLIDEYLNSIHGKD
ncbi:MAG: hypothetical protein AAGC88_06095, partial [Bacteroidota bacterium]